MSKVVQLGDVGTAVEFTVKENDAAKDISAATLTELIFKQGAVIITRAAAFKTTGADGVLVCTLTAQDLPAVGTWAVQARIVTPSGGWRSTLDQIRVDAVL